jgi:hypothetical protein
MAKVTPMSDCCGADSILCENPSKRKCPADGRECAEVGIITLRHHLKAPWKHSLSEQRYYFCDSPLCDVVYFGEHGSVFTLDDIRGPIGQKHVEQGQSPQEKVICYCFGVTQADAENDPAAKVFVIQQTQEHGCACETRNPSGRCCLKDFPRLD